MIIEDSSKWRKIVLVSVISVIILTGLFIAIRYFIESQKKINYIIPGVPFIGIYNHTGKYNNLDHFTPEAVAEVTDYWYPGENNYGDINKFLSDSSDNFQSVIQLFSQSGKYNVRMEHLQLDELKKYLNAEARTPLLSALDVDANQPTDVSFAPFVLIIGIKESEQRLVLHDPWFGNNFEMSFDEFNKRSARMNPSWRNNFLVVQPADLKNKLKEIQSRNVSAYPANTAAMQKAQNSQNMFKNYAIGWGAWKASQTDLALEYFSKTRNDSNYDEIFPPLFKVSITAYLADMYLHKKDFDNALKFITESVSLNHDLDKPYKNWPGYELGNNAPGHFGEIALPYRVQSKIYLAMGDSQKAADSYNAALAIYRIIP